MAKVGGNYHCSCQKGFATARALAQHRRDSPIHQNNHEQTRSPSDAIPHPITEDVANGQAVNLVEDTSPTTSTTAGSTTTPTTKQSTAQKKKKSKRNRGTGQANRAAGSYTYSPVVLTRYYNPNWELEYQMSGPDHTQCSRDCDWCGICAIREPY
ncbi:hypothetical protein F5B18DRAFT_593824 [Nemania serpens]|nr:hypothetical protein F5B18DRAFT_593824 [Nemania serpens]